MLLDTQVLLWWLRDDRKLGRKARALIAEPTSDVSVSAVSIWEIAIKTALGKLDWRDGPSTTLGSCVTDCGFAELPVTVPHAAAVRDLPARHGDPFDRLLLAQAAHEGLRILSADENLQRYDAAIIDATI